jgi:NhaA family Na+:H+ antiporter
MAQPQSGKATTGTLPREPIDRLLGPLTRFLHVEAAGGAVLLVCASAALILANSPFAEPYLAIWKTPLGIQIGSHELVHSLKHWINDGLMGIFFFVIGLEVKRELVLGELSDVRRAALPVAAALGGMLVPAAVYLALQAGEPAQRGWGIPMATDIAFVVGCLAALGSRVPRPLRALLLSLAIADDIGAILVIAIGYTEKILGLALVLGFAGLLAIVGLARLGVRSIGIYVVVGAAVWLGFHESGVHATIAGVLVGLVTPTRAWIPDSSLGLTVDRVRALASGEGWQAPGTRRAALRELATAARETVSPLERIEMSLHPWSSFAIMPVFALANAGIPIRIESFGEPVAMAVMAGLVFGKPVGIVAVSFLAVRLGLAELPRGVSWTALLGAGFLAGIGFTMALFIAELALAGPMLEAAKVGVLAGSALAALIGVVILLVALPRDAGDG